MSPLPLPAGNLLAILDSMESGLIVLDRDARVQLWNRWLVRCSGIAAADAVNRPLIDVLPAVASTRLEQAVWHALHNGLPSLLSPALHGTLLPLFRSPAEREQGLRLHQLTHVIPVRAETETGTTCLIQINDVTANISRERLLRQQTEVLRRASSTDELTGLANRQSFDATLEREFNRANRTGESIALLIADIDYFAHFNDNAGQAAGDAALLALGKHLRKQVRPLGDIVARYGGDKFAVLIPGAAMSQMQKLARGLQQVPGLDKALTLSAGIAVMRPGAGASTDTLISSADIALFQARQEGRNCAVCFDTENGSFIRCD